MKVYSAPSDIPIPDIMMRDINQYDKECRIYEAKVIEWVKNNSTPHPLNGKVVTKPYADGLATYVVGKINGKVSLIHIATGDGWADASFERTATVAELKRLAH